MKVVSGVWSAFAGMFALVGSLALTVRLFTWYGSFDDEGYMLISLAHYVRQGHLYTQTFSQYGPFYFFIQGIFFQLLHLPVTHDMGRLVTLIYWVTASLLAAFFVYRFSKSAVFASAAGFCTMLTSLVLTYEPGHPQQVVLLLYMSAACLSQIPSSGRYALRLFLLGCVGAALVFTKVNIGGFYLAGLAQAIVCLMPAGKFRSVGIAFMAIYSIAFPWVLMHSSLNHGFRGYCVLATFGGLLTLVCGTLFKLPDPLRPRVFLWSAVGLFAGAGAIILATLLHGTSLTSLVSGVVLDPLQHPKLFEIPLYISSLKLLILVTLALTVFALVVRRFGKSSSIDVMRCAIGVISIFLLTLPSALVLPKYSLLNDPLSVLVDFSMHRIQWVVPLLPLSLWPQPHWKQTGNALFARFFITFMAITQFLEPYPVAGSQMGIAAAPMILWAFLVINDGITGLRSRSSSKRTEGLPWDAVLSCTVLFILVGLTIGLVAQSHFPPASTKLRGAAWLRLPPDEKAQYESIVQTVCANCGTLFSMPGMYSFNLWSGVPTPNGWNLTAWMKGLSPARQDEILTILKSDPRACAIYNPAHVHVWDQDEDSATAAALPLVHYITTEMPKIAEFGEYQVRVHPRDAATAQ